jgi:hypothetical protein
LGKFNVSVATYLNVEAAFDYVSGGLKMSLDGAHCVVSVACNTVT